MDALLMERSLRIAVVLLASGAFSFVHSKQTESNELVSALGVHPNASPELYEVEENYTEAMSRRAKVADVKA